jgi:hypothetical protein
MAQVKAEDVDLVLLCTSTPDDLFGGAAQVLCLKYIGHWYNRYKINSVFICENPCMAPRMVKPSYANKFQKRLCVIFQNEN